MKFFTRKKNENYEGLEAEINAALEELSLLHVDTEEYQKAAANIELMCKAKNYEKDFALNKTELAKAGLTVLGSIVGIVLVLNYEKLDAVTSKAFGLVRKL